VSPEEEALAAVVRALDELGIPYMVTGSVASSFHGRPRATHDTDVVIDPEPRQLEHLLHDLESAGFYVEPERARDALRRRLQFNAIATESGSKIDLIVRKDRPFSREELRRRQPVDLRLGAEVAMATPEDTILSKLEWARKAGGSERQLADAAGVLDLNPDLDRAYVERWAAELGVSDLWLELSSRQGRTR
jgi:hypothetical protein